MSPGTVSIGGAESLTVIVNDAEAELPEPSVAVQVTVVVPSGNVLPEEGAQTSVGVGSIASTALAVYVTTAPDGLVACTVMFAGTVTTGGVVSWTVTENDPEPVLLCASVAVQLTVVVPTGKVPPEEGEHKGAIGPSTMSEAEAENVTTAPEGPVAGVVMLPGTETEGAVVSTTVMSKTTESGTSVRGSLVVHVTVDVVIANAEPDAGTHVTGSGPKTAWVAVGSVQLATAPPELVASSV